MPFEHESPIRRHRNCWLRSNIRQCSHSCTHARTQADTFRAIFAGPKCYYCILLVANIILCHTGAESRTILVWEWKKFWMTTSMKHLPRPVTSSIRVKCHWSRSDHSEFAQCGQKEFICSKLSTWKRKSRAMNHGLRRASFFSQG